MERFVVDTNVLFSFFWKGSWVREIILDPDVILLAPEKVFEELDKHSSEICSKAKISEEEFKFWIGLLESEVIEVKFDEFKERLPEAKEACPDEKDIEFFAVALLYNVPLWSQETELTKQEKVKVLSNKDMFKKFGFLRPSS